MADLGLGFVFNSAFTLRPNVNIEMGREDNETIFGLGLSYNFGRTR
jgi:hypothetical protein